ncbi:MAG: PD-(D/E)XK nuclease family protein [bacterium]|nr:PD-(D/E)XK nuclease family protein [bacterium]
MPINMNDFVSRMDLLECDPDVALKGLTDQITLTQSSLKAYCTCPHKFIYRYILCITPAKLAMPLALGSAVHKSLEYALTNYSSEDDDVLLADAIDKGLQSLDEAILGAPDSADPAELDLLSELRPSNDDTQKARAQLMAMVQGWFDTSLPQLVGPEPDVRAVEVPLKALLITDDDSRTTVTLRGKADAIVAHKPNIIKVIEHKTAGRPAYSDGAELVLDMQLLTYAFMLALNANVTLGPDERIQAVYDTLIKPQHRLGKKGFADLCTRMRDAVTADPMKYFVLDVVDLTPDLIERAEEMLQYLIQHLLRQRPCEWPQYLGSCAQYSGCPYRELCMAVGHISHVDQLLTAGHSALLHQFTSTVPHPELPKD